ncbi:non-homologous end-joining DNA ligase [Nocardia sp. NBC_01009]|uniref:non-homologous end-joining DNA ligase n=1 Tax=Nocardia sp. NBC_01009 TaxID=2975996 RepID=UPI00386A1F66|nr:non-homologous end-joining DNA ligase [Nocardia sp. NBC_01009]
MAVPAPMLAVAGRPPDTADWAIEMKWDGVRVLALCKGEACRLYSRNKREITDSYPELAAALAESACGRALILDGEVIAQTSSGAPSFGLLQRRMHVVRPTAQLIASVPVQFYGFDVLSVDGEDVTVLPYLTRRAHLDGLDLPGRLVSVPPYWLEVAADRMLEVAREHHLEGIVSKEIEAAYHPGRRSPTWIKTPIRKTAEAIVVGWISGTGMMAPTFGSLVLAAHDKAGRLTYIGNVGTGFTMAARRSLRARLDELATTVVPFGAPAAGRGHGHSRGGGGGVHWVRPELVGDIEFREFTGEGLRHPSWRGLRSDKDLAEVTFPG